MGLVRERLETALRALATLEELSGHVEQPVPRDAAIQRFEHTFEAAWKAAQTFLRTVEGVEAASPKRVIRECFALGLLDDGQARSALAMADDRNLTAHTYHEEVAVAIAGRLKDYATLLRSWLLAMMASSDSG